jgi:hypothetical protein
MGKQRTLNAEWRQQNDTVRYPFTNVASLTSRDGRVIVEGTFIDAALFPAGGQTGLYISAVELTHQEATIRIGDDGTDDRCSGSFSLIQPSDSIALFDSYGRPAGILVSEAARLGIFQSWGVGSHLFDQKTSEFCTAVCMPTAATGVYGVRLADDSVLTGDVWFVGEDGVVLRTSTETRKGEEVTVIRVDVVGDPLFRRRLCSPQSLFTTPRFIKQLRIVHAGGEFNCTPDAYGNIRIAEDNDLNAKTVMRIRNSADGIVISLAGANE